MPGTIAELSIALGLDTSRMAPGAAMVRAIMGQMRDAASDAATGIDRSMARASASVYAAAVATDSAKRSIVSSLAQIRAAAAAASDIDIKVKADVATGKLEATLAALEAQDVKITARVVPDAASIVATKAAIEATSGGGGGGGLGGILTALRIIGMGGRGGRGGGSLPIPGAGALFGFGGIPVAGAGSLGMFAGLGREHYLMTGVGLGGYAAGGAIGAGLYGAGVLAPSLVGGGSDLAVMRDASAEVQTYGKQLDKLNRAIALYGAGSTQARAAQYDLNQTVQAMGPAVTAAVAATNKQKNAVAAFWDQQTRTAKVSALSIQQQTLTLASTFVPLVAHAAQQNLAIINTGIKPLFAWLEGPHGKGIFTDLENIFKHDLPIGIDIATNSVEVFLKSIDYLAKVVSQGHLLETIDKWVQRANSGAGFQTLTHYMDLLLADFHAWAHLLSLLGQDIWLLFRQDSQTAASIVDWLTKMLQKIHDYLSSASGKSQVHTIFAVHKQEILAMLDLLPILVGGFSHMYMTVAPALTMALTTVLRAVAPVLTAFASNPFGAWILGLSLIAWKLGFLGNLMSVTLFPMFKSLFGLITTLIQRWFSVAAAADTATVSEVTAANAGGAGGGGGKVPLGTKFPTVAKYGGIATAGALGVFGGQAVGGVIGQSGLGGILGGAGMGAAVGGIPGAAIGAAIGAALAGYQRGVEIQTQGILKNLKSAKDGTGILSQITQDPTGYLSLMSINNDLKAAGVSSADIPKAMQQLQDMYNKNNNLTQPEIDNTVSWWAHAHDKFNSVGIDLNRWGDQWNVLTQLGVQSGDQMNTAYKLWANGMMGITGDVKGTEQDAATLQTLFQGFNGNASEVYDTFGAFSSHVKGALQATQANIAIVNSLWGAGVWKTQDYISGANFLGNLSKNAGPIIGAAMDANAQLWAEGDKNAGDYVRMSQMLNTVAQQTAPLTADEQRLFAREWHNNNRSLKGLSDMIATEQAVAQLEGPLTGNAMIVFQGLWDKNIHNMDTLATDIATYTIVAAEMGNLSTSDLGVITADLAKGVTNTDQIEADIKAARDAAHKAQLSGAIGAIGNTLWGAPGDIQNAVNQIINSMWARALTSKIPVFPKFMPQMPTPPPPPPPDSGPGRQHGGIVDFPLSGAWAILHGLEYVVPAHKASPQLQMAMMAAINGVKTPFATVGSTGVPSNVGATVGASEPSKHVHIESLQLIGSQATPRQLSEELAWEMKYGK